MVKLGVQPGTLELFIPRSGDFVCTLQRRDNVAWDLATLITLSIGETSPVTWTATLDGVFARFAVDEVAVAVVVANKPRTARLFYENGATRLLWLRGTVTLA